MILIKKASEAEHALIRQIAHQTWPSTFANILSQEQIGFMLEWMYSSAALLEQSRQKNHHFLLAWEEEQAQGFSSFEPNYRGEPITRIHKLYILPNTQGKGIGKALIEHIASQAKQQQNAALSLNVNRYNPAVSFYQHLGFSIVGQEDINIGNGFLMEDYIMKKML